MYFAESVSATLNMCICLQRWYANISAWVCAKCPELWLDVNWGLCGGCSAVLLLWLAELFIVLKNMEVYMVAEKQEEELLRSVVLTWSRRMRPPQEHPRPQELNLQPWKQHLCHQHFDKINSSRPKKKSPATTKPSQSHTLICGLTHANPFIH